MRYVSTMIWDIVKQYKTSLYSTRSAIFLENIGRILFPLLMWYALDGVLQWNNYRLWWLWAVWIMTGLIGSVRRWYDSRVYAKIYEQLAHGMIERQQNITASQKTARLALLNETIETFEQSIPELIAQTMWLVWWLIIIATLNITIFWACLCLFLIIFGLYRWRSKDITFYSAAYNDTLEKQVDIITSNKDTEFRTHVHELMQRNIKLSDIETKNFWISWMIVMWLLVFSIFTAVKWGIVEYGALFSLIMYVFQTVESILSMPLFYQQWLRIKEIIARLQQS